MAAESQAGAPGDALAAAVEAALALPDQDRNISLPAAVRCVLLDSEEGSKEQLLLAVKTLRGRLPERARPLLDAIEAELKDPRLETAGSPSEGSMAVAAGSSVGAKEEQDEDEDEDDEDGTPFMLNNQKLPLAVLLNIVSGLEPEDLNPAAGACKSLCIPININLQYTLFLIRLLRLIVLGPELARQLGDIDDENDPDSSEDESGSSTGASDGE